ncbi:putative reverse transcriptase domain-containing protein [Tanacetum coccineum]
MFEWVTNKKQRFQFIEEKLCSALILALPEGSEDFIVYCDASIKGLGAVLMQREKANVVADALRRRTGTTVKVFEALGMTISLDHPKQNLEWSK